MSLLQRRTVQLLNNLPTERHTQRDIGDAECRVDLSFRRQRPPTLAPGDWRARLKINGELQCVWPTGLVLTPMGAFLNELFFSRQSGLSVFSWNNSCFSSL